jgi:histidyl-tRNA synthetase
LLYSSLKQEISLYQAPRGTRDILPQEQAYWRYIEEKAADISRLYGYSRIDTPAFEDTELFVRSVGLGTDIVEKEMYTFTDRRGNQLTLRPEGTAPVCRAYLEHGMHNQPQPVKLYYLAPIYRYERPQAGRYRQHYQFGYEAIGEEDPALDAEVINMAWRFFELVGLKRLSLLINSIGCRKCRPDYLATLRKYYAPTCARSVKSDWRKIH